MLLNFEIKKSKNLIKNNKTVCKKYLWNIVFRNDDFFYIKNYLFQIESSSEFLWQSQLRHRWDEGIKDCFANICDAQFKYAHEYLGNQPRLVVTPLTDR